MSPSRRIRVLAGSLALLLLPLGLLAAPALRGSEATDPPGFGLITVHPGQTIRINVTCFDHTIERYPPDPCHGAAMFHNAVGEVLNEAQYDLKPGESAFLEFTPPRVTGDVLIPPVRINPCWLPAAGGAVIPTVEVLDDAGNLLLFENAASPRMSEYNNTFTNPAVISGFNPQPDPPGFGLVTLSSGLMLRMNVSCFAHPVNGFPPDPCRGTVLLHDMAGDVVAQRGYDLKPGEAASFEFSPANDRTGVDFEPCVLPATGGRAIPNVELVDVSTGQTKFLINNAAVRMSQFR